MRFSLLNFKVNRLYMVFLKQNNKQQSYQSSRLYTDPSLQGFWHGPKIHFYMHHVTADVSGLARRGQMKGPWPCSEPDVWW